MGKKGRAEEGKGRRKKGEEMKVIAVVGAKDAGKTALIERLIPRLKKHGKVGCVKHAERLDFPAFVPLRGAAVRLKDTERMFSAGADVVLGVSEDFTMKICRQRKELGELLKEMEREGVDFLIVEGFKGSELPKIVLKGIKGEVKERVALRMQHSEVSEEELDEIVNFILSLEDVTSSPH